MSAGSSRKRVSTTTLDRFFQQENSLPYDDIEEQEIEDDPTHRDVNVTDRVFDSQEIESGLTVENVNCPNVENSGRVLTQNEDEEIIEIQEDVSGPTNVSKEGTSSDINSGPTDVSK